MGTVIHYEELWVWWLLGAYFPVVFLCVFSVFCKHCLQGGALFSHPLLTVSSVQDLVFRNSVQDLVH